MKISLWHSILFALFLVACGDDSSTSANNLNDGSSSKSSPSTVVAVDPADVIVGSMTDSRDGQTYKTVKIGTQTWMAQNLNYETENSYCYNGYINCPQYGRLYKWATATSACPTGWHLPSRDEWEPLFNAVGGQSTIGGVFLTAGLVLKSTWGWNSSGNGTDAFGFSAFPTGRRTSGGVYDLEGESAIFWSSSEFDSDYASVMWLNYNTDTACHNCSSYKNIGFSVRCLKD